MNEEKIIYTSIFYIIIYINNKCIHKYKISQMKIAYKTILSLYTIYIRIYFARSFVYVTSVIAEIIHVQINIRHNFLKIIYKKDGTEREENPLTHSNLKMLNDFRYRFVGKKPPFRRP